MSFNVSPPARKNRTLLWVALAVAGLLAACCIGAAFANRGKLKVADESGQKVWVNKINPGNTLTGNIVFDIPTDAKITSLELHDSALSRGATVRMN